MNEVIQEKSRKIVTNAKNHFLTHQLIDMQTQILKKIKTKSIKCLLNSENF